MKNPSFAFRTNGFSLLELMISVAIIGVLAAVAIPAFLKYMRRTQAVEALTLIRKIYDGQVAYFYLDHVKQDGARLSAQFISAGPEPTTVPPGEKVLANWADSAWESMKFAADSTVRYSYQAIATGTDTSSAFTAQARGDLDGDSITSLFQRTATVHPIKGEVIGGSGIYKVNEIE